MRTLIVQQVGMSPLMTEPPTQVGKWKSPSTTEPPLRVILTRLSSPLKTSEHDGAAHGRAPTWRTWGWHAQSQPGDSGADLGPHTATNSATRQNGPVGSLSRWTPAYVAQICSRCGLTGQRGRTSRFTCPGCGFDCDVGLNAAENVLQRGFQDSSADLSKIPLPLRSG